MSEHKALTGVEIKDADKGQVQAVFARLNVVDRDGDVTIKGAFKDGANVRIGAYGHASWGPVRKASFVPLPPVGKGTIHTTGDDVILDGRFFLNTAGGRETFELVKEMGDLQEWSYGYDVLESDRGDFEGEPVRFLKDLAVHEVCPVLLGAGVNTHTVAVKGGLSYADDAADALAHVEAFVERSRSLADLRAKEGRVISTANRDRLAALRSALADAGTALDELLAESDPNKDRDALAREILRFQRLGISL